MAVVTNRLLLNFARIFGPVTESLSLIDVTVRRQLPIRRTKTSDSPALFWLTHSMLKAEATVERSIVFYIDDQSEMIPNVEQRLGVMLGRHDGTFNCIDR